MFVGREKERFEKKVCQCQCVFVCIVFSWEEAQWSSACGPRAGPPCHVGHCPRRHYLLLLLGQHCPPSSSESDRRRGPPKRRVPGAVASSDCDLLRLHLLLTGTLTGEAPRWPSWSWQKKATASAEQSAAAADHCSQWRSFEMRASAEQRKRRQLFHPLKELQSS